MQHIAMQCTCIQRNFHSAACIELHVYAAALQCEMDLYSAKPRMHPHMDSAAFVCSCICNALHLYSAAFVYVLDYRIRPAMDSAACVCRCIVLSCICIQPHLYTYWICTRPNSDSAEFVFSPPSMHSHLFLYAAELECALYLHPAEYPIAFILI